MQTAAQLIRKARAQRGWSQAELARAAGVTASTISLYEGGRRDPSVAALARILAVTGHELRLRQRPARATLDPHVQAVKLEQVLDLAGSLPARHSDTIGVAWYDESR